MSTSCCAYKLAVTQLNVYQISNSKEVSDKGQVHRGRFATKNSPDDNAFPRQWQYRKPEILVEKRLQKPIQLLKLLISRVSI